MLRILNAATSLLNQTTIKQCNHYTNPQPATRNQQIRNPLTHIQPRIQLLMLHTSNIKTSTTQPKHIFIWR
jgi:hypothetical protein